MTWFWAKDLFTSFSCTVDNAAWWINMIIYGADYDECLLFENVIEEVDNYTVFVSLLSQNK